MDKAIMLFFLLVITLSSAMFGGIGIRGAPGVPGMGPGMGYGLAPVLPFERERPKTIPRREIRREILRTPPPVPRREIRREIRREMLRTPPPVPRREIRREILRTPPPVPRREIRREILRTPPPVPRREIRRESRPRVEKYKLSFGRPKYYKKK
jgi:hypothetical protein